MIRAQLAIGTFCAAMFMSSSAFAVVISGPLSYTTPGLVGTMDPTAPPPPSDPVSERGYAQQILDLNQNQTLVVGGLTYKSNTAINYSGTVTGGTQSLGAITNVPAGYEYVLAKYDGQNAGYVLFYIGGEASTIPLFPYNLWTTNREQYELSHWTGFNRTTTTKVPEPTALTLLGAGFLAFGAMRRRRARA